MNCETCGEQAVYGWSDRDLTTTGTATRHNCAKCFSAEFRDRVLGLIDRHGMLKAGETAVLAVSGEKDSTVMMHMVAEYLRTHDIQMNVSVIAVDEGIGDYRTRCVELVRKQAEGLGFAMRESSFAAEYRTTLDFIYDNRPQNAYRMCFYCCSIRGEIVKKHVRGIAADKVFTGATLNDSVEHALMCLLKGQIDGQGLPVYRPAPSSPEFCSPLVAVTGFQCALYAYLNGIEFLNEDCKYCSEHLRDDVADGLNLIEDRNPGIMSKFYAGYAALVRQHERNEPSS